MGNAKAKEVMNSTVADRNDGEECNEARDDHGRNGEGDDNCLTCLSEQSKTISFNVLLLCTGEKGPRKCRGFETSYPGRIARAGLRSEAVVWLYCNGGRRELGFLQVERWRSDHTRVHDNCRRRMRFTSHVVTS